jgi:hypothetical protein
MAASEGDAEAQLLTLEGPLSARPVDAGGGRHQVVISGAKAEAASLNQFISSRQERLRNRQAERFGGAEIDAQLELFRPLDLEITR